MWAQFPTVKGTIKDSTSKSVIEGADIFLLIKESKKALLHTRSGADGFVFGQVPEGSYRLVIVAAGYNNDTIALVVKKGDSAALNVDVVLGIAGNELDGVVVKATPKPISVKGDTVVFHADAFAVRPNAQFEDLLRKLPGIEIDKDGNITMQGQKIDKITVNGKDLFLSDIKQANSLPAEMISSIEAFGTQSDRAKFSGVKESSNTKTLNLKTKKGMDQAWFGNAYASKGQGTSYAAGGQTTKLGGERMLTASGKLNNINNRFLGVESKNLGSQNGIQTTGSLDINYREKWGKKLTVGASLSGNGQRLDVLQNTSRRTFFSDSSLQENRLGQSVNKNYNYPGHVMLTYDADSMNQFQLNTSVSVQNSTNLSQDTAATQNLLNNGYSYLGSRTQTDNKTTQKSFNLNNQLDWRHRFAKQGRSLQLSVQQSIQTSSSPGSLFTVLNSYDSSGNALLKQVTNQQYTQSVDGSGYGASVMYTEPLAKGHNVSFTYSFNTQLQKSDKNSFDFDSTTGKYDKPSDITTNRFNNRNSSHKIEGSYGMNNKTMNYQIGLGWQYNTLDNLNFTPDRHIKQNFTNIFPRALINFNLGKGKSLSFNYNGASTAPSIEQLQPLKDITNPLLETVGNPDLKQSFNHSMSAYLNSYSMKNFRGIMLSLQGDVTQNQIVASTTLLSGGVQQQQYINVNGTYHLGSTASYSFGLGNKQGTKNSGSVSTHLRYGHDAGIINGEDNVTSSITWGQTLKLNYGITDKFIGELRGGVDYSGYQYTVTPGSNTQSWSQNATVNVSYELPLGINIQGTYSWMHQGTSGLLPSQSSGVLNAAIFKRLFAKQRWQLRLSGFDLLNTNRNYTQSAASNYIYTSQTNQLQRMLLLSLVYDFRLYPGLKKAGMASGANPFGRG
ncbi:Outer membrane receptor proteins, mostly Fe transport [Filimonas lacunae]|uniref:Outer membrane receptor proteins, mostly Fe transport n=1 Tax=Filimonas lacunae TaxID=477680 RepID=A0A173MBQ0_9BACT|nr:hypothetical protein FLA_0941 [Filimonas lacunae]SIT33754.1 Outer membrane receptor proteins, mostly Fe transport [Filimonas lacunae]